MSQGINNDMAANKPRRVVKNLRWWMLILFLLGVTVNYITRNSLGILAPELKSSLGITTEQYSWIVGAFQLAYTLFQPLCGWLIDVIFGEAIIFARIGDATSSSSNQQWRGLRGIWGFCTARRKMT